MRVPLALPLLALALALLPPPMAHGKGLEQTLTLGVGEEYNSNVNEKSRAQADWVTTASATGKARYEAARFKADASIDGACYFYTQGRRADEFKGTAQVKADAEVLKELLHVEGEGQFQQVYTNLSRGETNPTDSTRDQVNQNVLTGRATLTPRLGERLAVKLGYQFTATLYSKPDLDKYANSLFLQGTCDLSPPLRLLLEAQALRQTAQGAWFERAVLAGGFTWEYARDGALTVKAGPRLTRYDSGDSMVDPYWEARLTQSLGRFKAELETSSVYTENPSSRYTSRKTGASASVACELERTTLKLRAGVSYLDGQGTQDTAMTTLALQASHALTERLSLKASFTREFSETDRKILTRWYLDGSATYDLGRDFSLEAYLRWKLSESSRGGNDDYTVNIAGLRLKKTF